MNALTESSSGMLKLVNLVMAKKPLMMERCGKYLNDLYNQCDIEYWMQSIVKMGAVKSYTLSGY